MGWYTGQMGEQWHLQVCREWHAHRREALGLMLGSEVSAEMGLGFVATYLLTHLLLFG